MSGAITPFVELYDGFFFTPNKEPCTARYLFEKSLYEDCGLDRKLNLETFEDYIEQYSKKNEFKKELAYEIIEIVEKEPDDLTKSVELDEFLNEDNNE